VTNELLEELRKAADSPAPKDFRPGVTSVNGRTPDEIRTDAIPQIDTEEEWEEAVRAMGVRIPDGYGLMLVEAILAGSQNDAAWHRDAEDKGQKHTAYTAPNTVQRWRYRFKVVLKSTRADEDIAALAAEARKAKRGKPLLVKTGGTMVIALSDFQVGKTDRRGGTAELLERSEVALAKMVERVKQIRPAEIHLYDGGDSTEGFESSPNAQRTNDLGQTEQIRVWRRIFWRWISALSPLTERLVVAGVPSNHCAVRQGKNYVSTTDDDWGIEVVAQVADIAAGNPEAFGHIEFVVPARHDEHLILEAVDGTLIGLAHGHQCGQPNQATEYIKKNSRRGIGQAKVIFLNHFHHLRMQAFGDDQWMIMCPTNDNGTASPGSSRSSSRMAAGATCTSPGPEVSTSGQPS
jgi:hypothetical protein